jgi:hypothetical protein
MTSLPAAPAMTTLVVVRHPVALTGRTVGVRVLAGIGAIRQAQLLVPQAVTRVARVARVVREARVARVVAGHSATTGVLLVQVPAEASRGAIGEAMAARFVAAIGRSVVVLVVARSVKASGVARC